MRAPNEKLIETLFTHHALLVLGTTGASVYTPSTREEYEKGYDARLMGASGFDELYLQFKTPNLLQGDGYLDDYGFATTAHQHERLQDCPLDTAYYVTHLFRSVEQIQRAQHGAKEPLDFLRWYVAIEVGRLDAQLQRFRYSASLADLRTHSVLYNTRADRTRKHPKTPLASGSWIPGDELLLRFRDSRIGAQVILAGTAAEKPVDLPRLRALSDRACMMSPTRAREMVRADEQGDWGTMLRKNIVTLPVDEEEE